MSYFNNTASCPTWICVKFRESNVQHTEEWLLLSGLLSLQYHSDRICMFLFLEIVVLSNAQIWKSKFHIQIDKWPVTPWTTRDASGENEEDCGCTVNQKGPCLVWRLVDKDIWKWVVGAEHPGTAHLSDQFRKQPWPNKVISLQTENWSKKLGHLICLNPWR